MQVAQTNRSKYLKFFHYFSKKILLVALLAAIPIFLLGQQQGHRYSNRNFNEVAFIPGLVYDLGDNYSTYVWHVHYLRSSDQLSNKISVGISVEYIGGDETHMTSGPLVALHPAGPLVILYSPGITIKKMEASVEYFFSNHFELALEFGIGEHLHFGPSAGFSLSGYDNHLSVGLHTGFAF